MPCKPSRKAPTTSTRCGLAKPPVFRAATWTSSPWRPTEIIATCNRHGSGADISIIEGTKGLHDGVAVDGSDSNAALARLLDAPVILVVDARGLTRGVAPLVEAQARFDKDVRTAGVILNRVGGARHEAKLRAAIAHYTDLPVLGAVTDNPALTIPEGHLGLLPANDHPQACKVVDAMTEAVRTQVDLEQVLAIARTARFPATNDEYESPVQNERTVRIGIARDAAFGFYYPEDLEGLQAAGAELHFFDTMTDESLPDVDGLFIGGGFPERHMDALAANEALRRTLKARIRSRVCQSTPSVAVSCTLSRSLEHAGKRAPMVGAIEADTVMHEKPRGRGYVKLRENGKALWPLLDGTRGRAHRQRPRVPLLGPRELRTEHELRLRGRPRPRCRRQARRPHRAQRAGEL